MAYFTLTYGKVRTSRQSSRFAFQPFTGRFGGGVFVKDADWITDAEIREGKTSPVVAQFDTTRECEEFVSRVLSGEIKSIPHESNFVGWPALRERVALMERVAKQGQAS